MKMPASLLVAAAFMGSLLPSSTMSWELGSGNRGMWNSNCDYLGQDFRGVGSSSQSCGDICADDPNCSHWTWYNGNCFLKTGNEHLTSPLQGATCGFILGRFNETIPIMTLPMPPPSTAALPPPMDTWMEGSSGRGAWAPNCDYPGQNIRSVGGTPSEACGEMCADDPKCSHWTWYNGNCWIKTGSERPSLPLRGASCGFVFGRFNEMTRNMIMPPATVMVPIPPPMGTWMVRSGGQGMWASNCDYPGQDTRTIASPRDDCGDICAGDPQCSHWAWYNGNCWIKTGGQRPAAPLQGADCGYILGRFYTPAPLPFAPVIPPPAGTWLKGSGGRSAFAYNCDLPGNDIRDFPLGNPDACGSSCADEPRCSHWTWYNGNCWMKSGGERPSTVLVGATCGFVFGRFNQTTMGTPMLPPTDVVQQMPMVQWKLINGGLGMVAGVCDFPGHDYVSMPSPPGYDCGFMCMDNPQCTHWRWYDGQCSLKVGKESNVTLLPGATCGFISGRFNEPSSNLMTTSQPSMTPATIQPAYDDVFQPMAFEPKMGTRAPVLANGMTSIEVEDMLTFINALRLSSKLQPVVLNDALVLAATEHSKDQADHCVLAHSGSDGSTPELRASRHGYNGKVVWEHISVGKQTMTEILDPWWGPTSHYDDILQTEATEVGFARAVNIECDDYRSYWTLVFSAPQ
uniref:Apple domain-containing protein n=1 Tax=Globisporangium ultimum (strain ATCC 200006 / CBS 805.95 / DAOM BR144) TaxID=431595 RepID=K3WZR8_GLOUD